MEWLAGKCIQNGEAIVELETMYEEWIYRQSEVQLLLDLVDSNPDIFEINEDEAREDDVRRILDDITNKIEKDLN